MRVLIVLFLSFCLSQSLFGQAKERDSILQLLQDYHNQKDYKTLLEVIKDAQKNIKLNSASDSLYLAKLKNYKSYTINSSHQEQEKNKILGKIIALCPNNYEGLVFKAEILYLSGEIEIFNGFDIMVYQKMEKAMSVLESLENEPSSKLSLRIYTILADYALKLDDIEKYKTYASKAHEIFDKSTFEISEKLTFYVSRIRQLRIVNTDEEKLLNYIEKIKKLYLEEAPTKSNELIYIVAQVQAARFYLKQYQKNVSGSKKKAYRFINNIISNTNEDKITQYYRKEAWYIKNDLIIEEDKLEDALKSNKELIAFCKPDEPIMRYILQQRIRILLKLNEFEAANKEIYDMIRLFHSASENLKSDYSNFEGYKKINYITLFLDLSDAFKKFKAKDSSVRKTINLLNKLSLYQFKNSIGNQLTTPGTRALFQRIIFNFITSKHYGLGYRMDTPKLLETIENVENTLNWQEFLQKRAYGKLQFIDNYIYKENELRNRLVTARKSKQDSSITKLKLQLKLLKDNFKEKHPNYSSFAISDFSVVNFQKKLQNNEVVLRYKNIKDVLYVFVVSKNDINLIKIGDSKTISETVSAYKTSLTQRKNTSTLSEQLYQQIIPEQVLSYDHINIIPDEYLYDVPFEALKTENGKHLIEDQTILYAPYLFLLHHRADLKNIEEQVDNTNLMIFTPSYDNEREKGDDVIVRSDPYHLYGAKKESQLLSKLFKNTSFTNNSATKENFKKYAPEAKLLHLSMHADINIQTPELSYLLFSQANKDVDNKLYLEELNGINLSANMAVLSACNTGSTLNTNTDKTIVSLHRTFTKAGVPTTVASLWNAPDIATQEIMVEFYKQLKTGKTKAKALQLAKLHYLKTTDDALLRAPFYWAGFVINGTNDALIIPKSNTPYVVWIIVLALLAIIIVGFCVRKISFKQ